MAAAKKIWTESDCMYGPSNHPDLLSVQADPKTVKGKGYLTGIGYMAPHRGIFGNGSNLCPRATPACTKACISHSGRGRANPLSSPIHRARETRRNLFLASPELYFTLLQSEVAALAAKAKRMGMHPCVRMNGTSDILWERYALFVAIQERFPSVQWYDYTKIPIGSRALFHGHLTFSWSGENDAECREALALGVSVAVPYKTLPVTDNFGGTGKVPVVDGDVSDLRFLDPPGVIVGLKVKAISAARREKDNTPGFAKLSLAMA